MRHSTCCGHSWAYAHTTGWCAQKLAAAGVSVAEQDVQSVINAIVFIFRGALSAGADGAAVKAALDSSSDVSTPVADVLAKAVDESVCRCSLGPYRIFIH